MTFRPNQDLKHFRAVPRWRYLARDFFSALFVASIILSASFAAGVVEIILRGLLK